MKEKIDLDNKKLVGLSERFVGLTCTDGLNHPLSREDVSTHHLEIIKGIDCERPELQSALIEVNGEARVVLGKLLGKIPTAHQRLMAEVKDYKYNEAMLFQNRLNAIELFEGGMQCYSKGLIANAIKMFTRSIHDWSNDCRVYLFRGICHILSDNPQKAEEDLKEAVLWSEREDKRVASVVKLNLAQFYFACSKCYADSKETAKQGEELAKAIDLAREITSNDPEFNEAHNIMQEYLAAK